MKHTDEETLAMMALGEETEPSASLHLYECDQCRGEFEALRRVVTTMSTTDDADGDLLTPSEAVWDSIATELHLSVTPDPSAPHDDAATISSSRPKPLQRLRRSTVALAACAALFGAASGSAITWWVTQTNSSTRQTSADGKRLESLRSTSAGYASLDDRSGSRSLNITVKDLPRTSGYFEVWLMDRTHTKLVSMGVLGPDGHATLPIPDNIDLREYSVVDVSVQPYNGKPDHSGDSIVRGAYAG
ncbi:anti-sigma factor [Streptomyces sp. MS191]|uniref:anti-sigma factor n=1 Tax=Streptomyces sp. ms191 TaxID=1827978 RepID=UPI0011CEB19F|nr:anti-sigma factor [Streptomyces sp. ms191]